MRRSVVRLVAAVFLAAATLAVVPTSPAAAAACSSAEGVSVVVDFHELGGGVRQVCDTDGAGKYASAQFTESGFDLTRVQRQPGFVCRVDGLPSSDDEPCVNTPPADAYWGVWWSDGKSGSWSYSSQGVDSLKVPEGGYVALSWNNSSTKSPPGATPTAHASSPSPSPSPSGPGPSGGGGGGGNGAGSGGSAGSSGGGAASGAPGTPSATAPSESPKAASSTSPGTKVRRPTQSASGKPSRQAVGATPTPGEQPSIENEASPPAGNADAAAPDPVGGDPAGMPVWLAPALIGLLFAGAAATVVVRRRGMPEP